MKLKNKWMMVLLAVGMITAGTASADILYEIDSFNNNNTISTTYWIAGITTINVASGLTGTTDAELPVLQTVCPDINAQDQSGVARFANALAGSGDVRQTVTTDAFSGGYFQFGVTGGGGNMNLTDLAFDAVRATTSTSVRGYNIDVSIDGGAYVDLGAANITNMRDDGLEAFVLDMTGAEFQGISSVDFRVFATGGGIEWTDFEINGAIVPEPATMSLLALGGIAMLKRRKK